MYKYNLLFVNNSQPRPGLRILRTEDYQAMIAANPGTMHENWGDFYSHFARDELPAKIANSYRENMREQTVIDDHSLVVATPDEVDETNKDVMYLIDENCEGLRLYAPITQDQADYKSSLVYVILSLAFLEDLFSDERQGTLQTGLKELENLFHKT